MPALEIRTNISVADPKAFVKDFSEFSATTLGKPLAYIAVHLVHDQNLAWAGTFDPAVLLNVTSLDNLQPENTEKFSKAFFGYFKEKLGIPDNRGYILFVDPGRANIGHTSTTFATIFGK
ncbi:Tautomerase/MIF [Dichomitus squalens]|uniref:L-dopachrome isomerase n=1 Tax=Dichomitus squalens TaxID=114155 RepID=A0A4Q9MFC8_9APHY|nr:Tautomerase/MIF [Dichomitus squalens]